METKTVKGFSLAILVFLLVLVVAGFLAYSQASAGDLLIKYGGNITAGQCNYCHFDLDTFRNPRLIFSHKVHFDKGARCQACHLEFPHTPGKTVRPPMDICFNCHGQIHGGQGEVAKKDCSACHPPAHRRTPPDHTSEWKALTHKLDRDQNRCLMCHTGKSCEDCHRAKGVKPKPVESYVYKGFYPKPEGAKGAIDLSAPASASQCKPCHASWGISRNPGVIFSHAFHLLVRCQACHQVFPHQPEGLQRPTMENCYACHGLRHGSKGLVAREDCAVCHPSAFDLMPAAHNAEFIAGAHKTVALVQEAYCSMCHKSDFCQDCHTRRQVLPEDHQTPEWRSAHGKRGFTEPKYCSTCHSQSFCNRCHQTPMPHPPLWLGQHQETGKENKGDCLVCHRKDWQTCNNCHHPNFKTEKLVLDRCVRCHSDYRKDKQQLMVNVNLLIHRVHFAEFGVIGKTVAGPYQCNKCHPIHAAAGCYDFEGLCYKCHGARDQQTGREIAPYGRGVLCTRCHPQMLQRGAPRGGAL